MTNFQGPYYPLPEAAKLLNLSNTELKYEIETDSLKAVVYTKSRPMLLLQKEQPGSWIGYATCQYRGHYTLHKSYILSLLDNEKINVGTGFGTLIEHSGVSALSNQYPFQMPPPHKPIQRWSTLENDVLLNNLDKLFATPLPKEHEPALKAVNDMVRTIATAMGKEDSLKEAGTPEYQGPEFVLDFKSNSQFSPQDLRIPASEISKLQSIKGEQAKEQKLLETVRSSAPMSAGIRENQLHSLIERILIKHPKARAKEVQQIIEQDSINEDSLYDTGRIILSVDEHCIEWSSKHGKEQVLKWTSLPPLISRIRKKISD